MHRLAWLLILSVGFLGCSNLLSTMFKAQVLSENYAVAAGTESDVPEIIDGNPETIGKLKIPREARPNLGYSMIPTAEATITFPSERHIAKIVLLADQMNGVQLYAYVSSRDDWKLLRELKGNVPARLEIKTSVRTSKLRIISRAIPSRGSTGTFGRRFNAGPRDVEAPTLREVEVYGFVEI